MFVSQYLSLSLNPALIRMLLGDAFRNNSTVLPSRSYGNCAQ